MGPGEQKYFTKGFHNKLYPLWPVPVFGDPKDTHIRSQLIQEHFAFELRELLKEKQNTRAGSDSIEVSVISEEPTISTLDNKDGYGMYRTILSR
jgi:hypothetical protein